MKNDLEFKVIEFDPFAARGELSRSAPATEGQTEIWTSLVMSPIATLAYNESIAVTVKTSLDPHRLQAAIDLLVQKHDALRMSFSPMGRSLFIAKNLKLPLHIIDLRNDLMQDRLASWQKLRENATREAFVIDQAPLLRISLIKFSAEDSRLLLSAHHLVCDGWSLAVILQDLAKAYSEGRLEDAPSFADYAMNEHHSVDPKAASYWKNIYQDGGSVLELPIA
ncbi:MAG: hypothetical protein EOP07_22150, partial [Proteobacteria bacterium]